MKSKTKYNIDYNKIVEIFCKAKLGEVANVVPLEAGEFNTAYFVTADSKEYVLKIAPKDNNNVLTYENNLMEREVDFYSIIATKSDVKIPKVYFYDDTSTLIPSPYFIMEKLQSKPLTSCAIDSNQKAIVYDKLGEIVAKLHSIEGDRFGYKQNQLQDNWYLAIKSMASNIIIDCQKLGKKSKCADKLLKYIDRYKSILEKVKSRYVHFDLWDGNIFYQADGDNIQLTIIDTERGLWGDGLGDFVSIEMLTPLEKKMSVIGYNRIAKEPIKFTDEEKIRFNIMQAYLGLIVYTEKFFRYDKLQFKYFINIVLSRLLLKKSFKVLNHYDKR